MSIIRQYPFYRRFQGGPTGFVIHLERGVVAHTGVGQAFWFRPQTGALSEVPASDRELPLIFHAMTADRQDVTCQLAVTFRFVDPVRAAGRFDFAIFPPAAEPPSGYHQVTTVLGQLAQAIVLGTVAGLTLEDALTRGPAGIKTALNEGLVGNDRLGEVGVGVVALSVLAVRAEGDVEKAMQTPLREKLQSEADAATYARRALAVERERTIEENELATKIELAVRRERLVTQQGANARREAEEAAAAALIAARAEAERLLVQTEAKARETRDLGAATAAAEQAALEAYAEAGPEVLRALAMKELAANLPAIGSLTITPELLTGWLAGSVASTARGLSEPAPDAGQLG
ncbi:MAG: SPFH domain-containing protein [Bifidobacteriaceae bacterium]|jgi:regulator of protease activity HflC (stomatin/prohibitin superfamily)|nr:SPFH domain-containing protein [Bifidobacteriaceae bacterium]